MANWFERVRAGLLASLLLCAVAPVLAADNPMPRPPQLERDVQFWIRVYTEVDTNAGFLHDQSNLGVVYDTLHFRTDATPAERERIVDGARDHYAAALKRIAEAGEAPLSEEDQRIKALWGAEVTPARLRAAVDDIRFQLGQADRFRAGLIRSGAWETHIAETLANLGLPAELAVLPHVESSFNPAAYSKVGAAGLWQFMRSTGRRYMRIDSAVDDRLDPFRSTEAAAQLLAYNYRVLGSWPLALTAYNHGTAGVRHAKESLGTEDIVTIVRSYHSRTFGFASRNFYVSFLAALEIDHDPAKYFGALPKQPEAHFQEVQLPAYVAVGALEHTLKIDGGRLRMLNPALLESVWDGRQRIPRAYHLRLPADGQHWTSELLAERLGTHELYAGQRAPPHYRVQRGDTLANIADRFGISIHALARLNGLRTSVRLRSGRVLNVPESPALPAGSVEALVAANNAAPGSAGEGAAPARAATAAVSAGAAGAAGTAAPAGPAHAVAPAAAAPAAAAPPGAAASAAQGRVASTAAPTSAVAPAAGQRAGIITRPGVAPARTAVLAGTPAGSPGGAIPEDVAQRESAEDAAAAQLATVVVHGHVTTPQPLSAAQAEALGPSLGPASDAQQSADPIDYSVAKDGSIRVTADETLGHYADWLDVPTAELRTLNHLKAKRPVLIGQRIHLEFRNSAREAFEQRRRDYHQALQASYFASHRIVGTQVYIARAGDSLWTITQRGSLLPMWLLQQYNPDVDLADLHTGVQLVMPRVEQVGSGG